MTHNLSFWEMDSYFNHVDVAIIGSGIVGLNAAVNLKLNAPSLKIVVLERGFLPSGASTKNAGFACFGSPSELLDDLKTLDEDKVFSLVAKRWQGLQRLKRILGGKSMDYKQWGGYEVFDQDDAYDQCASKLAYLNKMLQPIIKNNSVFVIDDKKIARFGLQNVKHLIYNNAEGQLHAGMMMTALAKKAQELNVIIINSIQVNKFETDGGYVAVSTDKEITFQTKKLLIAVNGFANQLLPDIAVVPARSQVLITAPVEDLKLKGTFHLDKGYYYFRNIGKRVLLGGGRNLDFKGEQTSEFGLTSLIQERLEHLLKHTILPGVDYKIESRWSGIMGLGDRDKRYIVKRVQDQVYCAVRMGGMGIAVGSLVGQEAAQMVLEG